FGIVSEWQRAICNPFGMWSVVAGRPPALRHGPGDGGSGPYAATGIVSSGSGPTYAATGMEVLSGTLDWSSMHTDPAFWRENVTKFEEKDCKVLRVLLKLLEVSRDSRTLAVACHDVGQFMQHHSHGKFIVQELKGKELAMGLMAHADPEVQKQALLCVQKLMISNWEFFK
ncbi:hypothetical protein CYMTET_22246, partial [Cymbomonas tetramitiformis]